MNPDEMNPMQSASSNLATLAFRFEMVRPQGMQVVLVDRQGNPTNRFPIRPQLLEPGRLDVRA